MRLTRWLKGTNDQDGDGTKGGSVPEPKKRNRNMAKKPTTKRATKKKAAELAAAATTMATAPDPQTGGVGVVSDDTPTQAQVKKARKEAAEAQFAAADEKGAPTSAEIADTNLRLAARGY